MKILVTGANGLLGQKLVALLTKHPEHTLIATGRRDNRLPEEYGEVYYRTMDITNSEEVNKVVGEEKPAVIINTAAMTNVDQCEDEQETCLQMNVEAVRYLIRSCSEHEVFLLHLSTDFIFDGTAGPYTEEDQPNPISFYGESKLKAEQFLQQSNIDFAIARTVLVFGITPHMSRSNIVLWVKKSLEEGKELQIVNDQWRTPTLAEDLALGCLLIAEKKAKGVFNISGEEFMTPYDIAIATARYFGLDESLIHCTDASKFSQKAKRPPRTGFILDKAKRELGYRPHSFQEGLSVLENQLDWL